MHSDLTWLDQVIFNNYTNPHEESTSSNNLQPCLSRTVRRTRVFFNEASKKTKRRRVAEFTNERASSDGLQFAADVVSGNDQGQVSANFTSFSAVEVLTLMLDLDISINEMYRA